jgi:hypothetical protein
MSEYRERSHVNEVVEIASGPEWLQQMVYNDNSVIYALADQLLVYARKDTPKAILKVARDLRDVTAESLQLYEKTFELGDVPRANLRKYS